MPRNALLIDLNIRVVTENAPIRTGCPSYLGIGSKPHQY